MMPLMISEVPQAMLAAGAARKPACTPNSGSARSPGFGTS
jgi:hypothetical protein